MQRRIVSSVLAFLILFGIGAAAQAQQKKKKEGAQIVKDDGKEESKDHGYGGIIPDFKIGAWGWFDEEGFNLDAVPRGAPLTQCRTQPGFKGSRYYLEPGDIVTKVNGKTFTTVQEFVDALNSAGIPGYRDVVIEAWDAKNKKNLTLYVTLIKVKK